jgi:hypothetical protein
MNVFACCINRPELVQTFPPSVLYLVTSKKCPDDFREYLFENGGYLKKIKHKDMKEILKKFKNGEIDLNSSKIKALLKFDKGNKRYRHRKKVIEQNMEFLNKLLKDFLSMEKKIKWPARKKDKKTELTREQDKEINKFFNDLNDMLKKIRPKSKIVDDPRPKLKLMKTVTK